MEQRRKRRAAFSPWHQRMLCLGTREGDTELSWRVGRRHSGDICWVKAQDRSKDVPLAPELDQTLPKLWCSREGTEHQSPFSTRIHTTVEPFLAFLGSSGVHLGGHSSRLEARETHSKSWGGEGNVASRRSSDTRSKTQISQIINVSVV